MTEIPKLQKLKCCYLDKKGEVSENPSICKQRKFLRKLPLSVYDTNTVFRGENPFCGHLPGNEITTRHAQPTENTLCPIAQEWLQKVVDHNLLTGYFPRCSSPHIATLSNFKTGESLVKIENGQPWVMVKNKWYQLTSTMLPKRI